MHMHRSALALSKTTFFNGQTNIFSKNWTGGLKISVPDRNFRQTKIVVTDPVTRLQIRTCHRGGLS